MINNPETDESVLDFGINEAEVNAAIRQELIKELNLEDLPIEVDVANIDTVKPEEFTLLRRNGFGGSDSSILLGVNPFKTVEELIRQKASATISEEESNVSKLAAVKKGNDLEPLIIQKASQMMGQAIFKTPHMYRHKAYPFMKMNFDGVFQLPSGQYIPVEIKLATVKGERHYNPFVAVHSQMANNQKNPMPTDFTMEPLGIPIKADHYGIPQYYYTQLQAEILALNAPYGYLAVLFETTWEVHIFFVHRDQKTQGDMLVAGYSAWERVMQSKEKQIMEAPLGGTLFNIKNNGGV